jgi:hypothetical protein
MDYLGGIFILIERGNVLGFEVLVFGGIDRRWIWVEKLFLLKS